MVCTRGAVTRAKTAAIKQAATTIDVEPFRFLDLPPELRNRVYTYLLKPEPESSQTYDLANLKEPAILAVSTLVRNEALPVFFAEASFELRIGADFVHRDPQPSNADDDPITTKHAGTLEIKRSLHRRIRDTLKEAVVFRCVTFRVCDDYYLYNSSNWRQMSAQQREECILSDVRLRFESTATGSSGGGGLEVTATARPRPIRRYWLEQPNRRLENRHEAVKKAAAEVVRREGFIGFTIEDLGDVAKAFRLRGWGG